MHKLMIAFLVAGFSFFSAQQVAAQESGKQAELFSLQVGTSMNQRPVTGDPISTSAMNDSNYDLAVVVPAYKQGILNLKVAGSVGFQKNDNNMGGINLGSTESTTLALTLREYFIDDCTACAYVGLGGYQTINDHTSFANGAFKRGGFSSSGVLGEVGVKVRLPAPDFMGNNEPYFDFNLSGKFSSEAKKDMVTTVGNAKITTLKYDDGDINAKVSFGVNIKNWFGK